MLREDPGILDSAGKHREICFDETEFLKYRVTQGEVGWTAVDEDAFVLRDYGRRHRRESILHEHHGVMLHHRLVG
jgi:hypothetical protein